jgi:hypothetical protein
LEEENHHVARRQLKMDEEYQQHVSRRQLQLKDMNQYAAQRSTADGRGR